MATTGISVIPHVYLGPFEANMSVDTLDEGPILGDVLEMGKDSLGIWFRGTLTVLRTEKIASDDIAAYCDTWSVGAPPVFGQARLTGDSTTRWGQIEILIACWLQMTGTRVSNLTFNILPVELQTRRIYNVKAPPE